MKDTYFSHIVVKPYIRLVPCDTSGYKWLFDGLQEYNGLPELWEPTFLY